MKQETTIKNITRVYTRTYQDGGQVTTYIEWIDTDGKSGRTEGNSFSAHMSALLDRAKREGLRHETEIW